MSRGFVPWPRRRVREDPFADVGVDRFMVFVPAIMSVGLLFSIATLLRDMFRWTGGRARERRTAIEARTVLTELVEEDIPEPRELGVLSRPSYLIGALLLVSAAAYVTIGSLANFLRDGGYVGDVGWLLALSLGLAAVVGFLGGVSLTVFAVWPNPPPWTLGPLRRAPLTTTPGREGQGPSWGLTAAFVSSLFVTGLVALLVGSARNAAMEFDRPVGEWLMEVDWLGRLSAIDPFGSTVISVGFVALIGVSGFRCRVMALVYPTMFVLSWVTSLVLSEVIARPRPHGISDAQSFPSGHMVQAVFIAGLLPLAIRVLLSDRTMAMWSQVVLGAAAVATGLHRIHRQDHWPLDIIGGAAIGVSAVLMTQWIIEHRSEHRRCHACPWSPHPAHRPWRTGLFILSPYVTRWVGWAGSLLALGAAATLVVATVVVGIPSDPEGYGFGSSISSPAQLGLAALMGVAGLASLRWRALSCFLMALAATGLGLFASVEYAPRVAIALTALLLVPAVFTWFAWQPGETIGSITVLAVVTVTVLTITAFGSNEVYGYYFGPTHPESVAEDPQWEADWLWLGAVGPRTATIVAGGWDDDADVELWYWTAGEARTAERTEADGEGLARFVLTDLRPGTQYQYLVVESGESSSDVSADSTFRTHREGAQNLIVVAGSCARSGSNGAVFDAIVGEDPDLFLALGDLHYANLDSSNPRDHLRQYARTLSQPGQAALFSSIPTAYVWDDHDYGPNDADRSSPSRLAVSEAYRRAVPNHGVDPNPDASIAQAFSVGRVRFVFIDTRSQRDASTMLGAVQLDWLIDELTGSAETHGLVVWANPTPWISQAGSGADDWSAYPEERRAIADALVEAGVDNLVMVSGDAHMVSIDDGTNSGYSSDGSPGFPVLHAAALDRIGNVKGGPYSHGAFPGGGQYGRLEILDDGGSVIEVRMSGHTWDGRELVQHTRVVSVPQMVTGS